MTIEESDPEDRPVVELPAEIVAAVRAGRINADDLVRRLQDEELLEDPDLKESLEQIRRGEYTVVRQRPDQA